MAGKPKPAFWFIVVLVAAGLAWFGLNRAGRVPSFLKGLGGGAPASSPGAQPSRPAGDVLEISFYSSSAKKSWIEAMTARFNAEGHKVGDKTVLVKAFHGNSGEQLDDLKSGKIKPDLWSPGDESWLALGEAYFRDVKQMKLFDEMKPLLNVPLVIAMWEPMAQALGYPKPIGWRDVAKVAMDPKGWASAGNPQWGAFRWGHAHPDANSGFLTVASEIYAVLQKTSGMTTADLANPAAISFLKGFEGAVEHYGLSNTWIDDLMRRKGPGYLSATVQYENTIIEGNLKYGNKPYKLVAVYPSEGCFFARHPVAIIKGEWMTPEREAAAKLFVDFLLSPEAQKAAMEMGVRPIAKMPPAAPFDAGHGVMADVSAVKAFEVPGEDVLKRLRDLWESVKVPATVVLILDRSGSMQGEPMENAKAGAVQFIRAMKPRDRVQVVVFSDQVTPLSDVCEIASCGEDLGQKVSTVFAEGGTALYDSIAAYYKELSAIKKSGEKRRYAILVLTDGDDTKSSLSFEDLMAVFPKGEDYDVPKVYTIAYGGEAKKDLLAQISNKTNARLFESSAAEIAKTYRELSADF